MADRDQVSAEPMLADATTVTPWARVVEILQAAPATYWLATMRPRGLPHVRPVLAVWVDGTLFLCAGQQTRKAKNLVRNSHCVVTVENEPLDLVLEGEAVKVRDAATLHRVAGAYASIYRWHPTVRDGAFHDVEGAPTAGPPPYDVYAIAPSIAFGFGTDETLVPTRWRFGVAG